MALLTDDMDIRTAFFRVTHGGNGDYYPEIIYKDKKGDNQRVDVRIAMSGGNAPTDVKRAIAELYRALEKHNLNNHPLDEPERWPNVL